MSTAGLSRAVPSLYSLALAALVFGPMFGPGCPLLRDAVSTPRSYPTDSALGLGDAAARAVPQDWLLATLSGVLDGCLVVKVILFLALWLAGWGAARMATVVLDGPGLGPALLATTVTIWNPYVAERLLQGHWSLLVGYAALPWTVCAAVRLRRGEGWPSWCALTVCLAAAALTPTGALLAAVVAVVTVGRRRIPAALALTVLASAPWLAASAVSGAGAESDPTGVAAFAARAEPGLGTLGALAGLGGIWNADAVPASRATWWALPATLALLAVVVLGVPVLWRRGSPARHLVLLAAAAVLLPAAAATPWGLDVLRWVVQHVPGAGLLRDTQKWVALAAPAYALAAAAGLQWLAKRVGSRAVVVAPIALVVVVLPDLAYGVAGQLRPVHYPAGWRAVADIMRESDAPGDVAVLPGGMFRVFPFAGDAPVLDPAPRMLPRDVLQTGELSVRGLVVRGEGTRASEVERLLQAGAPPAQLAVRGVGWILVERTSPGPLGDSARTLADLRPVFADDDLALYRIDGASEHRSAHRTLIVAAHLVWAVLLAGGALFALLGLRGRRAHES